MNIEEARSSVGKLVMTTSAGRKLVKSVAWHGPYKLIHVTKNGRCMLEGLGEEHRPAPTEIKLFMNTKQVIVMRTDLNMGVGKMCAQASHASMAFISKDAAVIDNYNTFTGSHFYKHIDDSRATEINLWLDNSFRKIVVAVSSEEELLAIHERALASGLISHLVEDNGTTVFNNVKTKTCCAIGPHWDSSFEGITDHLPLL